MGKPLGETKAFQDWIDKDRRQNVEAKPLSATKGKCHHCGKPHRIQSGGTLTCLGCGAPIEDGF